MKFDIWNFFRKSVEELKFNKNLARIMGALQDDLCECLIVTRRIILGMRKIPGIRRRENKNTHYIFNKVFR
jgi:hypothetical protein